MVVEHVTPGLPPAVQRRIAELRAEAARLRAELGDPEEALSTFVREHFDREALAAALRDELEHVTATLDDEDERPSDG